MKFLVSTRFHPLVCKVLVSLILQVSNMHKGVEFKQLWEFRKTENDLNSSNDEESKSSSEAAFKRHTLVSTLSSDENDEADTSFRVQQSNGGCARMQNQNKIDKGKKVQVQRQKKKNALTSNILKKDSNRNNNKRRNRASANEPVANLDDVKVHMEYLLEDLKVSTEKLLKWLKEEVQKLVANDTRPRTKRQKCNHREKDIEVRNKVNIENVQMHHQNSFDQENIIVQHQSSFKGNVLHVLDHKCAEDNFHVQQCNNFKDCFKEQHLNHPNSSIRIQNYNTGISERPFKGNLEASFDKSHQTLEAVVDNSQSSRHMISTEIKNSEKMLALPITTNNQAFSSNNDVQMQHQKCAASWSYNNFKDSVKEKHLNHPNSSMGVQSCKTGSSERPLKSNLELSFDNSRKTLEAIAHNSKSSRDCSGKMLALPLMSNNQSFRTIHDIQMHLQGNIKSSITSPNCYARSLDCLVKSTSITSGFDFNQAVLQHQVCHDKEIKSIPMSTKGKIETLGVSLESNFTPHLSSQQISPKYLTLPTVSSKRRILNRNFGASSCNYSQPIVTGNSAGVMTSGVNLMPDPNAYQGYLSGSQQEERHRQTVQNTGNRGYFDKRSTPYSTTGAGFPITFQQGKDSGLIIPSQVVLENLTRSKNITLGMRNEGEGVKFSGGSNGLSEHNVANKYSSLLNHKADSRVKPFSQP